MFETTSLDQNYPFQADALSSETTFCSERKPRALIAEDSADTRHILGKILEMEGIDCIFADNGADAIKYVQTKKPQILFLDLVLPNLNGFQVLLNLRNHNANTKICVISSAEREDIVRKAIDFGADDYIVKPIIPEIVIHKVNSLLNVGKAEDFYGFHCDFNAKMRCKDQVLDCKVTRVSNLTLDIFSEKSFTRDCGIFELDCPSLKHILGSTESLYVKKGTTEASPSVINTCEFVGFTEKNYHILTKVIAEAKFLDDAILRNQY